MSSLLEFPRPPLYQPARSLLLDCRALVGGQQGDGHTVPPALTVSPRLGEDQQRVGGGVGLNIIHCHYQTGSGQSFM